MKFKMTLLPSGRRAWRWVALRLLVFGTLLFAASFYVTSMPGSSYSGSLRDLADLDIDTRERLKSHVSMLAERIGERNVKRYASLKASLEYIENVLRIGGFQSLDTGSGLKY